MIAEKTKASPLDKILDFVRENDNGLFSKMSNIDFKAMTVAHLMKKTVFVLKDQKGISAYAIWNYPVLNTAFIGNVIVRKDLNKNGLLKKMLRMGKKICPSLKYIAFERCLKYPQRTRVYEIQKILKGVE